MNVIQNGLLMYIDHVVEGFFFIIEPVQGIVISQGTTKRGDHKRPQM